jgi:hypothetical protein
MVFRIEPWPFDDPDTVAVRYLVHTGKDPPVLVLEHVFDSDPTSSPEVMSFYLSDRERYEDLSSMDKADMPDTGNFPLMVLVDRSNFDPFGRPEKFPSERWALVQEVFLSLDKTQRAQLNKSFNHHREGMDFRLTFLKHCLVDSKPVYYRFIFDPIAGPSEFDWENTHFQFRHKDLDYFVEDTYCIEPSCNCNGVLALFHSRDVRSGAQTDPFIAVLSVEGKLRALSRRTVPEEVAKQVIDAFALSRVGDGTGPRASEELSKRWTEIRDVGAKVASRAFGRVARRGRYVCPLKRTEEDAKKELESSTKAPLAVGHFGRNDPCPCGSGKKYKRCCGAK